MKKICLAIILLVIFTGACAPSAASETLNISTKTAALPAEELTFLYKIVTEEETLYLLTYAGFGYGADPFRDCETSEAMNFYPTYWFTIDDGFATRHVPLIGSGTYYGVCTYNEDGWKFPIK